MTLEALKILHIEHNELEALPPSIGNLQALRWLSISVNHLVALPESMGDLSEYTRVIMAGNPLPEDMWEKLNEIESIIIIPKLREYFRERGEG